MVFNLVFPDIGILLYFIFFLIINLCLLISAVIAQIIVQIFNDS